MSVKERVKIFCNSINIKVKDFENSIGASNGYVNSISKGIGEDKLCLIIEKYPNLNIAWLLTGIGAMNIVQIEEADCMDHEVQLLTQRLEMQDKTIEDKENTIGLLTTQLEELRGQFDDQLKAKDTQINSLLAILANKTC